MYPDANIPIVILSLNRNLQAHEHFEIGQILSCYREIGVMIIGSGNIVHNLRATDNSGEIYDWARDFDLFVKDSIENRDFESLVNYERKGCLAELAVPTNEHFLPLLYVLGASVTSDFIHFPFEGFQHGSISLRSVQIQQ
jgi:4,5-DOPA dioxygenase extradiol